MFDSSCSLCSENVPINEMGHGPSAGGGLAVELTSPIDKRS